MPSEKSTMKRFRFSRSDHPYEINRHSTNTDHGSSGSGLKSMVTPSSGNSSRGGTRSRARWAMECSKLLEAMWELDESKPFRRPIDPCKYPEFYNRTSNPLDLQKIRIKFQQGSYASPEEFAKDVHKMFDYYKKFFSDPTSQIYAQAHRLSWWFESEMERIQVAATKPRRPKPKKPRDFLQNENSGNNSSSRPIPSLAPRTPVSSVSTIGGRTLPSIAPAPLVSTPLSAPLTTLTLPTSTEQPSDTANISPDTNIILSIKHGQCTILHSNPTTPEDATPGTHSTQPLQLNQPFLTHTSVTVTTAASSLESYTTAAFSATVPKSSVAQTTVSSALGTTHMSSSVTESSTAGSALMAFPGKQRRSGTGPTEGQGPRAFLDISTVWCGSCKFRPNRAVLLDADGLTMYLRKNDADVAFRIKADDVVRCLGHIEKTRKHTLFLSLLPGCSRRFSSVFGDKTGTCSLMAMFFPAVGVATISKIIHIFWLMSKKSIFGQLFSEVDSKAALELLSHIRPAILNRIGSGGSANEDSTSLPNGDLFHKRSHTETTVDKSPVRIRDISNQVAAPNSSASSVPGHQRSLTVPQVTAASFVLTTTTATTTTHSRSSSALSMSDVNRSSMARTETLLSTTTTAAAPNLTSSLQVSTASSTAAASDEIQSLSNWLCAPANVPIPPLRRSLDDHQTPARTPQTLTVNSADLAPSDPEPVSMDTSRPEAAAATAGADNPSTEQSGDVQESEISIVQIDDDDSDLEIVLPSEEDDMTITAQQEEADGEDLMVMAGKISIKCPVTQQIMKHPVKNKHCGHCYDRQGIEQLVKHRAEKARCPVPGCSNAFPLKMKDMLPDFELWSQIQSKLKLMPT